MEIVKGDKTEENDMYNPNKRYTWLPTDKFILNGEQFGVVLNTLRNILGTPEAAKILMADRANQAIEEVMAEAVNKGIIKEMKNE